MAVVATGGPDDNDHARFQETDRDYPRFAVIVTVVGGFKDRAFDDDIGIGEIQLAFGQRIVALGWVVGDRQFM